MWFWLVGHDERRRLGLRIILLTWSFSNMHRNLASTEGTVKFLYLVRVDVL